MWSRSTGFRVVGDAKALVDTKRDGQWLRPPVAFDIPGYQIRAAADGLDENAREALGVALETGWHCRATSLEPENGGDCVVASEAPNRAQCSVFVSASVKRAFDANNSQCEGWQFLQTLNSKSCMSCRYSTGLPTTTWTWRVSTEQAGRSWRERA